MIRERYAVWNNKGGVGKSTLTFHLASLYAADHPKERVLVVDMCPQANVSMMLLGSGDKGEKALISLETSTPAPTVAGYIDERIKRLAGTSTFEALPASTWMLQVSKYNANMPSNLYLIAGDGNLELLAAPIAYYANASFPEGIWGAVHKWIREVVDQVTNDNTSWTIFIDTNPSFAIYTELAMIAADKLIVPFNADDSSRHAVSAIVRLLYGAGKANPVYDKFTFRERTKANGLHAPKCHLFVGNRFTQYEGSAKAFSALHEAVADELLAIYKKDPSFFTDRKTKAKTRDEFLNIYTEEVRDFNTAGVVAAHEGELLRNLSIGTHRVHGHNIAVKKDRVEECAKSLADVAKRL